MNIYEEADDINTNLSTNTKNEQTSSDESQARQDSKKRRQRASVACTSCRDRRIRCVVPSGKKTCMQCERTDVPCVIKDDDERRRPISRAYVYSLLERVALLEHLLEDQGLPVPPSNHPPEIRHFTRRSRDMSSSDGMSKSPYASQTSTSPNSHIASSPFSSVVEPESKDHTPNKRSSITHSDSSDCARASKRRRKDSLISKTKVKVETIFNNDVEPPWGFCGSNKIGPSVTIPLTAGTHLWPATIFNTHDQNTHYSEVQNIDNEHSWYNALSNGAFVPPVCLRHSGDRQYGNPVPLEYPDNTNTGAGIGVTNLDFLPLSNSSSP